MRNTLPLLSRPPAPTNSSFSRAPAPLPTSDTPAHHVPTIRLISATPSAAGSAGDATPRKRLVPKRSKLGLLGGSSRAKDRTGKDLSDVVRRVGGAPSTGGSGFEIYVDQGEDPEMGEIVVVKKKKSRLGLDGMRWGALGEVTNVPSAKEQRTKESTKEKENAKGQNENLLKVKGDENQKWWSIGRGRKDSKGKEKEKEKEEKAPARSKTPEPARPLEGRARFNSLDSGILLNSPASRPEKKAKEQTGSVKSLLEVPLVTTTPVVGLLSANAGGDAPLTGSIAVRAIRSMRSLARMASWAQLSNDKEGNAAPEPTQTTKPKSKDTKEKKEKAAKKEGEPTKKKKKEKTKEKESAKEKEKTISRYSGSSFEAGALSSQPSPAPHATTVEGARTLTTRRKQSILGLGLPSTMRLSTVRDASGSSAGSVNAAIGVAQAPQRLSVDSAHLIMNAQGRPSSILSSGSSLRPPSTVSGISVETARSGRSSTSSAASVRWDEAGIRTVKEMQRQERRTRREQEAAAATAEGGKTKRDSRRSSDSRRRTPISAIFPDAQYAAGQRDSTGSLSPPASIAENPLVRVEEATADGHSAATDDERSTKSETPIKRSRSRPMSEQMLGRPRPQAVYDDDDGDALMDILDAATNDLASLINRLDLEATPASTAGTPLALSPFRVPQDSPLKGRAAAMRSPLKNELRESQASIASLRPYAKSQSPTALTKKRSQTISAAQGAHLIGQQIVPVSQLNWSVSPRKPTIRPKAQTHKRTPSAIDAEPIQVFHPLRPATTRSKAPVFSEPASRSATPIAVEPVAAPSSRTFGTRPSKVGLRTPKSSEDSPMHPSPTPVFSRAHGAGHVRRGSSLVPMNSKGSVGSLRRMGVQLTSETRKVLGMGGTLGGSTEPSVDPEDPDSDIPDELQVILSGQSDEEGATRPLTPFDDTLSFRPPPSPGSPPKSALPTPDVSVYASNEEARIPVFQLFDPQAKRAELDDGERSPTSASEDDTKKSFDFTGELRKLNESGGSDRASFVEQVEEAFKTPGRIQLGFDFDIHEQNQMLVPPVPALPVNLRARPTEAVPQSFSALEDTSMCGSDETGEHERSPGASQDSHEEPDISFMMRELEDECRVYSHRRGRNSSMQSKPSDGRLNTEFKFGGKPSPDKTTDSDIANPMLTLSDIIPPLSHSRSPSHHSNSMVEEDSSVLKSIMAQATDVLPEEASQIQENKTNHRPQMSVHFDDSAATQGHSHRESVVSFTGFDSFDEVRRGFEFHDQRPGFYPPANATYRPTKHSRDMSLFSIASVSSYGAVVRDGVQDPFGFDRDEPSRPPSMDDISISMSTVDDTFSFIHRNKPRRRVDSDASSFYFPQHTMHPYRRAAGAGHRRGPSAMSIASNMGPPISLYNRSFGAHAHRRNDSSLVNHSSHRREDSNTSASSVALSYAMHGAGSNHGHGNSSRNPWDSHTRDFSVDSMFSDYSERPAARPGLGDKMFDTVHGAPLSAISASPESTYSAPEEVNRMSWDSIMDPSRYQSRSAVDDSLFDKTNKRSSFAESIFGADPSFMQYTGRYIGGQRFRPLSIMSEASQHSPVKEDDTMITASPAMLGGGHVRRRSVASVVDASPCVRVEKRHAGLPGRALQFDMIQPPVRESPKSASRLVAQPSIASTSSFQFGDERMIKARQGLLSRQSLEESALMAQGEDLLASLRENSIFNRPSPAGRSRSSTCSTISASSGSGVDTPPLSNSDGSSVSGDSQSSIDIGHLNSLLANTSNPSSGISRARRARARGAGHRRRIDEARMSRSSVYETIQEEVSVGSSSPSASVSQPTPLHVSPAIANSMANSSVYVVESDGDSIYSETWDDETGITTLRQYYALRSEAQVTVDESKMVWPDTPFSLFALQSFDPPREPGAMQTLLEHSQKNYGPLPSDLRPHRVRSRTSSRPSPYPQLRSMRSNTSPEKVVYRSSPIQVFSDVPPVPKIKSTSVTSPAVLREQRSVNVVPTPPPVLGEIKPFTPFAVDINPSKVGKNPMGLPARPRVTSSTRRAALGWSKRSTGKSSTQDGKENASFAVPTPSGSLRINRPRPRGRPTPARVPRVPVPAA
ncbi:uncharacterized protein BXZ73DRAFT_81864 [Epithele typhae]|uniref:uncharacterized protein n=1 Tax=Epithele typhae TaxID=378194 RepID=UPI002007BB42|nr:uncharacterized protein BXZ73DRAFT_81864 [Epithele typhae]KAH9913689.1 hypothetical protein BXZ73DRAFT_81864 [Epithele typhae]